MRKYLFFSAVSGIALLFIWLTVFMITLTSWGEKLKEATLMKIAFLALVLFIAAEVMAFIVIFDKLPTVVACLLLAISSMIGYNTGRFCVTHNIREKE